VGRIGVPEGAAQLKRHRAAGHSLDDGPDGRQGAVRVVHERPAALVRDDLADGAGEVEVDNVEAHPIERAGRFGHRLRLDAHDLSGDRMVGGVDADEALAQSSFEEDLAVEHGFRDAVGGA
jgi:hypothetical protein